MPMASTTPALLDDLDLENEGSLQIFAPGAELLPANTTPAGVWLLLSGSVRSLAALPPQGDWRTVARHGPGELVGWLGLVHGRPLEHLRAAEAVQACHITAERFEQIWAQKALLRDWCAAQTPAIEAVHLLQQLAHGDPARVQQLEHWQQLLPQIRWLINAEPEEEAGALWFGVDGTPWPKPLAQEAWQQRLVLLPSPPSLTSSALVNAELSELLAPPAPQPLAYATKPATLELMPASGPLPVAMAICQALAGFFQVPVNRDNLRDQIESTLQRQSQLNLINMGQLISSMSLAVVMVEVPADQLERVPTPSVLLHGGHFALLDGVDNDGRLRLLEPELGPLRIPLADLLVPGQSTIPLLLVQRRSDSREARFNWSWFAPYIAPHKRELIEVLVASAVVNTLALVTPLGMQRLIDARFTGRVR